MNECEIKQYLVDFVLEFATNMNKIEHEIATQAEVDEKTDWFEEYHRQYMPVFEAYCTQKKRIYGGKCTSFGIPSQYNGIENAHEMIVNLRNERRAEVEFHTRTNEFGDTRYSFVVVKKKDGWKIDSYKWWDNCDQKWRNGIF